MPEGTITVVFTLLCAFFAGMYIGAFIGEQKAKTELFRVDNEGWRNSRYWYRKFVNHVRDVHMRDIESLEEFDEFDDGGLLDEEIE